MDIDRGQDFPIQSDLARLIRGAIDSTKMSGNFLSKTEWIGSVQPEKFRKKRSTCRGGPLFLVGPVLSKSFRSIIFDHSRPILNPRTSLFGIVHVQDEGKYLSLHFYVTADLSVLLVHPCTVTTGLELRRKQSVCFGC